MIVAQVGVARYLHWESNLVQNLELRRAHLVRYQGGGILVLKIELR